MLRAGIQRLRGSNRVSAVLVRGVGRQRRARARWVVVVAARSALQAERPAQAVPQSAEVPDRALEESRPVVPRRVEPAVKREDPPPAAQRTATSA